MSQNYETLLHRWFEEVWNQGREEVIDELFPDGIAHGLGNEKIRGSNAYKPFFRAFKNAFPDLKVTVEDWILDGDKLAIHCNVKANHTGEGIGISPTNLPVDFNFMGFLRIQDGKIAEAWNILDFMKMYQQMGVFSLRETDEKSIDNEALIRRWFTEVWNNKREDAIDEMLDVEGIHHGLDDNPVVGTENFKHFFRNFIDAFPDIQVDVTDVISEGDKIATRYTVKAKHLGSGLGFDKTKKSVEFTGSGICKVKDGKFIEVWNEINFLKMFQQLGVVNLGER